MILSMESFSKKVIMIKNNYYCHHRYFYRTISHLESGHREWRITNYIPTEYALSYLCASFLRHL